MNWEEEDIVSTSGCEENKLVKSEAFSSSFNDSGSCGFGESQGGNGNLGDLEKSNVISHSANHDGDSFTKYGLRMSAV